MLLVEGPNSNALKITRKSSNKQLKVPLKITNTLFKIYSDLLIIILIILQVWVRVNKYRNQKLMTVLF